MIIGEVVPVYRMNSFLKYQTHKWLNAAINGHLSVNVCKILSSLQFIWLFHSHVKLSTFYYWTGHNISVLILFSHNLIVKNSGSPPEKLAILMALKLSRCRRIPNFLFPKKMGSVRSEGKYHDTDVTFSCPTLLIERLMYFSNGSNFFSCSFSGLHVLTDIYTKMWQILGLSIIIIIWFDGVEKNQ